MIFFQKLSQKINGTMNLQEVNLLEADVKLQYALKIWINNIARKAMKFQTTMNFL